MILDAGKMSATGSGLDFVHIHRTTSFTVNMLGMDSKKLAIKIIGNIFGVSRPVEWF